MNNPTYKITMLGPTRVGKTSLIATIFNEVNDKLLTGMPFTMDTNNLATKRKLASHNRELKSSINAGSFNTGAVAGTQDSTEFEFSIKTTQGSEVLNFSVLDFPGGWLDPLNDHAEDKWQSIKNWLSDSAVIIIPVESTVLMEADNPDRKRSIVYNLLTNEVAETVRDWAKNRKENHPDEPSSIILAPIKCESYFTDNVLKGNKDKSGELESKVYEYYKEIIDFSKKEFGDLKHHLSIHYVPVDTIGCVHCTDGKWQKTDEGFLRFTGEYFVKGRELKTKGADDIFKLICKNIIATQEMFDKKRLQELTDEQKSAEDKAKDDKAYAERDEGFWGNLKLWWTDERKQRRKEAEESTKIVEEKEELTNEQRIKLEELGEIIKSISEQEFSSRHRCFWGEL